MGIPGIGKTTLAEILLIDYTERHGYQAIRIANDLSEIKEVKNPGRRQMFYYDDFLGTAKLDKLEKNEDKRIVEFLQQVAANKKWRARPEDYRRAERKLRPARRVSGKPFGCVGKQMRHRQDKDRQRQRAADPETAGHVS